MQVVFTGDFFQLPLVLNAEDDRRFCFRFPFVACHDPSFTLRDTVHNPSYQEAAAFPAFLCTSCQDCDRGMMTRRSCLSLPGPLRLAPVLAQATFLTRMFICLQCNHICLQKSLSFAPGVVVLLKLPLMPS